MRVIQIIALALAVVGLNASADDFCPESYLKDSLRVMIRRTVSLHDGQVEKVEFCRPLFVHTVALDAWGYDLSAGAEVIVNGAVKRYLHIPPTDPHYVISVDEVATSIEIVGRKHAFQMSEIRGVFSDIAAEPVTPLPTPIPTWSRPQMAGLSEQVIRAVDALVGFTSYDAYGMYLLPIKKAAAVANAVALAAGDASGYARPKFEDLLADLDAADTYFSTEFEMSQAFGKAKELMALREQIRRVLN